VRKTDTYSLRMPFKAKISAETVQEWVKRHAAGETMSSIAAADDVNVSTVSRRLRAAARAQAATAAAQPASGRAGGPAATASPHAANIAQIAPTNLPSSAAQDRPRAADPLLIPARARVHLYAPDGHWVASMNRPELEHALDVHRHRGPLTISLDPPRPQPPPA
jgi:hypothetical protein